VSGDVDHDRGYEAQERGQPDRPAGPRSGAAGDHGRDRHDHEDRGSHGQQGGEHTHATYVSGALAPGPGLGASNCSALVPGAGTRSEWFAA
jgi:hypothetical protein